MAVPRDDHQTLLLVTGIVFLARIPFLFSGYGSEEDAWGLILVARNISLSGIYEVSRMPGHPLQEYLLSLIWNWPAWTLNLFTAAASSMGVYFFMQSLRRLGMKDVSLAGIAFAFVPVYYMHSTDIMDYTWALALMMWALWLTVQGQYIWAGFIVGLAAGFRITAGAMVVPLAVWHFMQFRSVRQVMLSGLVTLLTAMVCFLPPFLTYGPGFFSTYYYFPYPPFLKNIYKGTIGAWGVAGSVAVTLALIAITRKMVLILATGLRHARTGTMELSLVMLCISAIVLYTYAFIRIPQKTAFVIPLIPFLLILFARYLSRKQMTAFTAVMICSSFFLGINLDDPIRGSEASAASVRMQIAGTPVLFDPLQGVVTADHSKRKAKMKYASALAERLSDVHDRTVIVAGWWQNELNFFSLGRKHPGVSILYYAEEAQLRDSLKSGCRVYFLPEQDVWNDIRWQKTFTRKLAEPVERLTGPIQ